MQIRSNTNIFLTFVGIIILQIVVSGLIDFGPLLFVSIYPLFLLTLPLNYSANKLMLWAFFTGLVIDYLSNSILGINSVASIFMVLFQPKVFKLLYRKGDLENQIRPGMRELGFSRFTAYIGINLIIHHIALTALESFGFILFFSTLPRVVVSLVVNLLLILAIEYGVYYRRG